MDMNSLDKIPYKNVLINTIHKQKNGNMINHRINNIIEEMIKRPDDLGIKFSLGDTDGTFLKYDDLSSEIVKEFIENLKNKNYEVELYISKYSINDSRHKKDSYFAIWWDTPNNRSPLR